MTTGKTIASTAWTFVNKMMFLLFNTQSSFVIAFLPSSKYLLKNFMAAVTICSDFGTQENRICHCFHFFPLFAMKWWDQMPWSFFECWVLSQLFHAPLSPLSWSSLVPLHFLPLVSSVYLRLLIFLQAILIPACDSSSQSFLLIN